MDSVSLCKRFKKLGIDNAPGQEGLQKKNKLDIRGQALDGIRVDFSHGDIDAHAPVPGCKKAFDKGFQTGGRQAYTEYRGSAYYREQLAEKLQNFTGAVIDKDKNIILTPGTQGALFLAMGSLVGRGDKVAIVEPDYFANRKLVEFFEGELIPVQLHYYQDEKSAGLDLKQLEAAFAQGVKLFLFSNPNNPTGAIYAYDEINMIARLAQRYQVTLLVDELYSRQIFDGNTYVHLCAQDEIPENLITIMGPSKTESLSGFRLGVAFGSADIIQRMEKLQAIVSLRCAGYCQAVFDVWFNEPEGFMDERIAKHQKIRDDILDIIHQTSGVRARITNSGSYLFVEMPELEVSIQDFVKIVRILAGVTITPGTEFGSQFSHHFRINFSQDHEAALDAMRRVMIVMERYRKVKH